MCATVGRLGARGGAGHPLWQGAGKPCLNVLQASGPMAVG